MADSDPQRFHACLEGESRMFPPRPDCADCARREFKSPDEVVAMMRGSVGQAVVCVECRAVRHWQFDFRLVNTTCVLVGDLDIETVECDDWLLVRMACAKCHVINGLVMKRTGGRCASGCYCNPRRVLQTNAEGDIRVMTKKRQATASQS